MSYKTGRRATMLLLAGAALSRPALAQDVPPEPKAPTPAPPNPAALPARPAPAASAIDKTKTYYVFFDQTIDVASMRSLRKQLTTLVEAGVAEITLVINSVGGQIDPMLITYSFIMALPAKIKTHAQGFVASAATILFLAGQDRSADRNARFLFHPSQRAIAGTMDEHQLRDNLMGFSAVTDVMKQIFHDRTRIPDSEIERFSRETVYYDAEQAQSVGFVETVADLRIPGPDRAKIVFLD